MVVNVSDKEISTKQVRNGGAVSSAPYGMVVWSTGIGTRPVIMYFMKQIGQGTRRVLATDKWMRVEGSDSIYALGGFAPINQPKVMNLFLYGYGAILNFLGILGTVMFTGPSNFNILEGLSKATMFLICNNAAQEFCPPFSSNMLFFSPLAKSRDEEQNGVVERTDVLDKQR